MTPQYEHQLPNGRRLNVVDVESAQKHLVTLINRYDDGDDRPLIIGDENAPKAVVLPIDQWFDLLEIADQAAADEQLARDVRAALADPRPPVPYDEFLTAAQEAEERGRRDRDDG
jgi:hypothetical protein